MYMSGKKINMNFFIFRFFYSDSGGDHHSSNLVNSGMEGHRDEGEGRGVQPHVVFYASLLSALAAMASTAICIVIVHVKGRLYF